MEIDNLMYLLVGLNIGLVLGVLTIWIRLAVILEGEE